MRSGNSMGLLKSVLTAFCLIILSGGCVRPNPMEGPGTLFIREMVQNPQAFKTIFEQEKPILKAHGFSAYSLHRDLFDARFLILTLKCSDLNEGLAFWESPDFTNVMAKAGIRDPMVWSGLDVKPREYENQPHMTGGIVIARNEVRSFDFWKKCWDAEGPHHHPWRGYIPSNYSIHHFLGNPDAAIVAHEASDVTKAPAFMTSNHMWGIMDSSGVVGIQFWYGYNLEQGTF